MSKQPAHSLPDPGDQPRRPDGEAAPAATDRGGRADALRRALAPVDLVLLSRERIQEVVDDAVRRGRMTRSDATELVANLFRRGRRQTEELLADFEQLLGRARDGDAPVDHDASSGTFPLANYDELTSGEIAERLGDLTPAELRKLRDHERRNANRKSVLAAIERRLA